MLERTPGARMLVPGLGFLFGGIVVALGLLAPTLTAFLVAYTVAGGLLSLYSGPMTALFQDVVHPAARSRVIGLSLVFAHLLGDAFAPSLIGGVSDALGGAQRGLDRALWIAPAFAIVAGVICLIGHRYVQADREAMIAGSGLAAPPVSALAGG